MNILIIGAGRRGLRIGRHLIEENKSVTFLDSSMARCQGAQAKLDCMAVCGSATNISRLIEAGIEDADTVIAVTNSDEVNIVSCGIVAANFPNVKTTIAAIRSITYMGEEGYSSNHLLGITNIINPDQEGALRIADTIRNGLYHDTIIFPGTDFFLFTATAGRESHYSNRSVADIKKYASYRFVLTGINRRGNLIVPSGDTVIRPGDVISFVSDDESAYAELSPAGDVRKYQVPDRIIIVGATRVARFLLLTFSPGERKKVTLIEKDGAIAEEFASLFPEILVLNTAITDEQVWEEEDLGSADLFISLTENDELNIVTSSYAKRIGVRRSIAMIKTNTNYCQFAQSLDVDLALSITDVTVDSLIRYLRGSGVSAMHTLFEGELEVYEYVVQDTFPFLGKALKNANLKKGVVLAGVKKADGTAIVPDGEYVFASGDRLILSIRHDDSSYLKELFL